MAHIISDKEYRELAAYRATGLTPEGISKLIWDGLEPAPLPLPLAENGFDKINRILAEEEWNK